MYNQSKKERKMRTLHKLKITLALAAGFTLSMTSCGLDEVLNPNAPTIEQLQNGATEADLRLLASGLESVMRNDLAFYYETVSIVGREYYDLTATDPRYTGELLGANGVALDNNGFLTTRAYAAQYRTIRTAYLLEEALENAAVALAQDLQNGYTGYAKTIRAYAMLLLLNRQFENGIRVDTRDPDNLGPFVSYTEGLATTMSLLNEAAAELASSGEEFAFELGGFTGFDTPTTFRSFNRAIAARVALYQGDMAMVRTLLGDSFLDMAGSLDNGPEHVFSLAGNDIPNPLFYVADQDIYGVQLDFVNDAEANDERVATKTRLFDTDLGNNGTVTTDGISTNVQVSLYGGNAAPIPIIRNEELILMMAEANIGTDNAATVTAINLIRNAAGLADYAGGTDNASLLDEIMVQRRYSLFGEGHRWIDLRRLNRLDEIVIERAGSVLHTQFPTPILEDELLGG